MFKTPKVDRIDGTGDQSAGYCSLEHVYQERTFESLPQRKMFCGRGITYVIRQTTISLPRDLLMFVLFVNGTIG